MKEPPPQDPGLSEDERTLARMGYAQELHRGMGAFSNFALSLSIICILAGGVTSFIQTRKVNLPGRAPAGVSKTTSYSPSAGPIAPTTGSTTPATRH